MSTTAKHPLRAALVAGVAAGLGVALSSPGIGQAAGTTTHTLRFHEDVVSARLAKADGTVLTGPRLPTPAAGDVLDIVSVHYTGDHLRHARRPSGTGHLQCIYAAAGPPDCTRHVVRGSSTLVFEGTPERVVLGTGRFLGATGRVISTTPLGGGDRDVVLRVTRRWT